ncbi:CHASE2 domain-containing protein [Pleurocapsales cyanobacterium LEGE 10410]|nr:CHASE2 domain-containing protein [Pleurocapsales cyanobacterium LEGE 10410]
MQDNSKFSYQIGGSLAHQSPSYIVRQADRELEEGLRQGEFCYVLNSRQMGKSSLRVRAMERLQASGTICIAIDLTGMGTQDLTPEKWYAGILRSIVSASKLKFNWRSWWREQRDLFSPVQRLALFIEEVLLRETTEKIVIFVDEIDRVLSQKFSLDDFFGLIHSCYQKRQVNPNYYRLTFTLLGVAAPRNLIRDKIQSPFEIGKAIKLQGFKLEEAAPLMLGLSQTTSPQKALAEILAWTGGQPFLTQKLCQLVAEAAKTKTDSVAQIVEKNLIDDWEVKDEPEHLRTIRDRLCYRDSSKTIRLLGLYQKILRQGKISLDRSPEQTELGLSGLVVARQGYLEINNPIYRGVFNSGWVEERLSELRPYNRAIAAWLASDKLDNTYLLRGQELQNVLTWSLNKSLADVDYQFLVASQNLAKQEAETALLAVEAASKLLATARKKAQRRANQQKLAKHWLAAIACSVTGLILLLRSTGILQTWEWNLLDRFFRWRLTDSQETRITLVTIDEQDIKQVGQWPIPDSTLAKTIRNIQAHQPRAIALDIYRDLPVPPGNQELLELFNQSRPNIYVVEKVIGDRVLSPPVSQQQVGFADQVIDSDGKIRRALLSLVDDRELRLSLGTKLAIDYLQDKGIELKPLDGDRYSLGKAIFNRLNSNDGGYVKADAGGYQILLNYWGTENNFQQYSLTEVLQGKVITQDLRDRLIFIGSTAESIKDLFYTPYSKGWFRSPQKMPGVFIQANVASYIIGAAIDNRPLLRTHDRLWESLGILWWGIVGVAVAWRRQKTGLILTVGCLNILSIIACYLAFLFGWWLPLMPALLALNATAITAVLIRNRQGDRLKFQHTLNLLLQESNSLVGKIALEYFKQSEEPKNQAAITQIQQQTK